MKLDKWPEEIECDGWVWKRDYLPNGVLFPSQFIDTLPAGCYYRRSEKIHVPPTMREIMEHLLKGGWVRYGEVFPAYHYKLDDSGQLKVCISQVDREWLSKADLPLVGPVNAKLWFLIQPGEWFEGAK